MYKIALNFLHADSSLALIKNNKILFAAEEERFRRVKHYSGFPTLCFNQALARFNLKLNDISEIYVNFNQSYNLLYRIKFLLKNFFKINYFPKIFHLFKRRNLKKIILQEMNENFNGKIIYQPHHLCHAASSILCSNFEKGICLSFDASGDFSSTEIFKFENNKITLLDKVTYPHSIGILYQALTQYIGFKSYGDEYKVMGLAAYGNPNYINQIKKLIIFDEKNGKFKLNLKYFVHQNLNFTNLSLGEPIFDNLYNSNLDELLGGARYPSEAINQRHKDIACSLQIVFEEILFKLLNFWNKKYNYKNLCLSGGCALNSLANGKIINNTKFENIYIPLNPSDAGGGIGSVFSKNFKNFEMENSFLGTEYSNEEVKKTIDNNLETIKSRGININYYDNLDALIEFTSEKIKNSKVVGWYQGRMEFGARALGNRSILANPLNPNMKKIINSKIKFREKFRPFAPSILENHLNEYFVTNKISKIPFMNIVLNIKTQYKKTIPAVVHNDNTCRVQTVNINENYRYFKLIESFYKKTGFPILLNTSFNVNEPICESPKDALECFLKTDMDMVVINDFVLIKNTK